MEPAGQNALRRARGQFAAMAATYALGVFNDNFYKQAAMLLFVAAGRPGMQSFVLVAFTAPFLLVAAPAGWFSDRFPKRRIVIAAKGVELAAMLCGAVGIAWGYTWLIFVMLVTMGTQATLFSPALNGSIPELYPEDYVARANGLLRAVVTAAVLAGTALAGVALATEWAAPAGLHPGRALVAVAVVAVALLGLVVSYGVPSRPAADPRAPFPWDGPWRTLVNLAETRHDPHLAVAILASAFIWSVGSLEVLLINPLGISQLALGQRWTGGLVATQMVGLAAGAVLSGWLGHGRPWNALLVPAGLGMSVLMLLLGAVPWLDPALHTPVAFVLVGAVGAAGGLFMIPAESFIQIRAPADRKGATLAAANFAAFAGISASAGVGWVLNEALGLAPTTSFAVTGAASLAFCPVLWVVFRRVPAPPAGTPLAPGKEDAPCSHA